MHASAVHRDREQLDCAARRLKTMLAVTFNMFATFCSSRSLERHKLQTSPQITTCQHQQYQAITACNHLNLSYMLHLRASVQSCLVCLAGAVLMVCS
jgi:ABC-type maltose transport system permease subunit